MRVLANKPQVILPIIPILTPVPFIGEIASPSGEWKNALNGFVHNSSAWASHPLTY
jgi:hypothetical protein